MWGSYPALTDGGCERMMDRGNRVFRSCSIVLAICMVVLIPACAVSNELGERYPIISGNSGRSTSGSSSTIIVSPPRADFTFTQNGNTVAFIDTSRGNPTTWYWTFGDRETSRVQNPGHYYSKKGTYIVTLKAGNSAGSTGTSTAVIVIP